MLTHLIIQKDVHTGYFISVRLILSGCYKAIRRLTKKNFYKKDFMLFKIINL